MTAHPPATRTALAIRHIPFEDLGLFEPVLKAAGYSVRYLDLDSGDLATLNPLEPDVLIVLGGPVGVYEDDAYPWLAEERRILAARLAQDRPVLGICLGAQQIAAALDAAVAPMGHKEIGFSPVTLTDAGQCGPLRHLEGMPVLHWHGDAFAIPEGATPLASTAACATQGFAIGNTVLALQFHPEVDAGTGFERWLTGHAAELAAAGIRPGDLRDQARTIPSDARIAATRMMREWLSRIAPLPQTLPQPQPQPLAEGCVGSVPLSDGDRAVFAAIADERQRQRQCIELIASENYASPAVLDAQGSVLTNKYAEGYPHRRYYGGCAHIDVVEDLAMDRLNRLFGSVHANVQPHSGSQANQAVFLALLAPGDTILGLDLKAGGHLTHGAAVNLSGRWFTIASYGVDPDTHLIDMEQVAALARIHRPKLLIAGGSAYPRTLDFARFRQIADEVGAVLMVDMAHFAGLVAGGVYPSPIPFADVVTSTTHKTLRGPRGGFVLTNDEAIARKVNSAIFPGLQGGPLMHVIAAKAVAFGEALDPSFKTYAQRVVENCRVLAGELAAGGLTITTGGTDCHLAVVDLRPLGVTGNVAEKALESVGITLNKNAIPNDPEKPMVTSGIRVGSAAGTSRGFGPDEYRQIAALMLDTLHAVRNGTLDSERADLGNRVRRLVGRFPLPY